MPGLPVGWPVRLDGRLLIRGRTLFTPTGRMLRLGPRGPGQLVKVQQGNGSRAFARRLVEAGAAHPVPPAHSTDDVTVVVPAYDRTAALARCLASLQGADVLVIDDGSADAAGVAAVCKAYGARCVRRSNGGPAAARNTAIPLLHKPFVAFLDSDCTPPLGWLERLRGHLEDPTVAAVAPRVVGGHRSPLDQGDRPALVRPGGEVSFVPTAALLVRRSALVPFDEGLRYGEDVDVVWRWVDAGMTVRYEPSVVVEHEEPGRLVDRLVRRFRYGTSAAPLAERHPAHLTHLVLPPWPTTVLALLLARRPVLAAVVAGVATRRVDRQVHDLELSARLVARSVDGTALGVGRGLALCGPLAWVLGSRHRRVGALLIAPYLREWAQQRPDLDPVTLTVTALLDQAAYGAGLLVGCLRHRTAAPLRPRMRAPGRN